MFTKCVHACKVSAHIFALHITGHLKLAEQVLFELSTFVAMDRGEFHSQGCSSFLPLDLQEGDVVHSVVDQLADLGFLLLPRVDRSLMLV